MKVSPLDLHACRLAPQAQSTAWGVGQTCTSEQGGKLLGHKRMGAIYKSHKELELDIQTSRRGLSILLPPEHRLYGNLFFSGPRDTGSQWIWGLIIFFSCYCGY